MEGKIALLSLPDSIKVQIEKEFGSVQDFYNLIYSLSVKEYMAYIKKDGNEKKNIESLFWKITDKLENMGVQDGMNLINQISLDFCEKEILPKYPPLTAEQEALLKKLGIK